MRKYQPITTSVLLLSFACLSFAQTAGRPSAVARMALPTGNLAWVVQVFTSGGILGTGEGDIGISSEGRVICASPEAPCGKDFMSSTLQTLVEMIQPGNLIFAKPISLCNDCYRNTIIIRRRDSMGMEHTYTASWDITSQSRVPREVLRVYDAVMALRK